LIYAIPITKINSNKSNLLADFFFIFTFIARHTDTDMMILLYIILYKLVSDETTTHVLFSVFYTFINIDHLSHVIYRRTAPPNLGQWIRVGIMSSVDIVNNLHSSQISDITKFDRQKSYTLKYKIRRSFPSNIS